MRIELQPTTLGANGSAVAMAVPGPRVWTPSTYIWTILITAFPALLAVLIAYLAGEPFVGVIIGSVPFGLLILWKPELGLYLMVLFVPFEYFGIMGGGAATITKFLGLYTAVALLVHLLGRRYIEMRSAAFWLALAFGAWSMLTIGVARDAEYAWICTLTRIQMIGLMFVILNACLSKEQARTFLWALFLAAVFSALASFVLTPEPERGIHVIRATVGTQNINDHAKDLLPGVFLFPFLLKECRGWARWLMIAAVTAILIGMIMTMSRSIYIAVYGGIIVTTLFWRGVPLGRRIMIAVGLTAVLAVVVLVGLIAGYVGSGVFQRMSELQQQGLESGGRLWLWQVAAQMGVAHPLTGVGIGQYVVEVLQYGMAAGAAHNDFLTHFAETGMPGILLYCAFLSVVFWSAWRVRDAALRASLLGMLVATVLASMANPSYANKSFWLQLSAAALAWLVFRADAGTEHADAPAQTSPQGLQA